MSDRSSIADRVEIEALRGEFTDAAMMRDYDRFASLFTEDGTWRIPYANVELVSRNEIYAGIGRAQGLLWEYFVQTTHPGRSSSRVTPQRSRDFFDVERHRGWCSPSRQSLRGLAGGRSQGPH